MRWWCYQPKKSESKKLWWYDRLLKPKELVRVIFSQLKALCEAIYAASILKQEPVRPWRRPPERGLIGIEPQEHRDHTKMNREAV